ncbi:hypothetical protein FLK61_25720 [Paenalkalicoccus suaedae]|uniref:DUF2628 domain-containing protein n=1 Tax=Paenalkalicoccus suaedae TaxID=2592382 RepID=A0A859FBS1_9BACI|nr:hypothetical protein [Paenalkalicoccus suaedae]QKS70171.1 hypothetical protein FLK61_25720 [Paenalkalicoccus suaedae]
MTKQVSFAFHDELSTIVQTNIEYYKTKWQKAKTPTRYAGFNWSAFLLAPFWSAARQLYMLSTLYMIFIGIFIISDAYLFIGLGDTILRFVFLPVLVLLLHTGFGFLANARYAAHVKRIIHAKSSGTTVPPLFMKSGRSVVTGALIPLMLGTVILFPSALTAATIIDQPVPDGVYVYDDNLPFPQTAVEANRDSFAKYSARINLLYIGEPVNSRSFTANLYVEENGEFVEYSSMTYGFFTQESVSLQLIDTADPTTPVADYRLDILIDDELVDSVEFTVTPIGS